MTWTFVLQLMALSFWFFLLLGAAARQASKIYNAHLDALAERYGTRNITTGRIIKEDE